MTDPPTENTEDREPDAPDPTGSESHTPRHGHAGGVPPDKALSDNGVPVCGGPGVRVWHAACCSDYHLYVGVSLLAAIFVWAGGG